MRVLVAPDKFKGTLTAGAAGAAMAAGVRAALPSAEVTVLPIADGGDGTVEAALAAGAEPRSTRVRGPLEAEVDAAWAMFPDGRAVIETATASGLVLVDPTPQTAARAHSFGSGQLVIAALDAGAREIVLGIGGSAMTDGGAGALRALGATVLDAAGRPLALGGLALAEVAALGLDRLDPRLGDVPVAIACDVDNPLTGPDGAAWVFGPQKGADPALCSALDAALVRWAAVLETTAGRSVQVAGSGAAGGFPVAFLAVSERVELVGGFELVAELLGLAAAVDAADLVLTGEGSLDAQSLRGKGPIGVADLARDRGVPVLAVAGRIAASAAELAAHGIVDHESLVSVAPSPSDALTAAARWCEVAARAVTERFNAPPAS